MVADWFASRTRAAMSVLINAWPIGIASRCSWRSTRESANWHGRWHRPRFRWVVRDGRHRYRSPDAIAKSPITEASLSILTRVEWRLLIIASIPWLLYNAAYQIAVSFLPLFFLESGLTIASSGAITALNTLLMIVSVQAGGIVLKRARNPDLVCHLATAGWCATLAAGRWIHTGGVDRAGVCSRGPASAFVSLLRGSAKESRAAGLGVFYTIYYAGCAVLPSVAGALYDFAGSAKPTLWMAAACAFPCVPILMLFRRGTRRASVYTGS